jgi:hypothetical protein
MTENTNISEAGRSGPKSSAQTPSKPEEKRKGSKTNPPGSAGTKPDAKEKAKKILERKDDKKLVEDSKAEITFSERVTTALKNKVAEHNKKYSKKVSLTQLKKVYRRGAGAFSASHRPGKSRDQWAMARVNMFLKMMRGGKVKDAYKKADQDIAKSSYDFYKDIDKVGDPMLDIERVAAEIEFTDVELYNAEQFLNQF